MLKVSKLSMDYLESPIGFSEMPKLGWKLVSNQRNVLQKVYRIQLAKDPIFEELV